MKPPVCELCGRRLDDEVRAGETRGDWVAFRDYEPLPPDVVGHPPGLGWFCHRHLSAARRLSRLKQDPALFLLRLRFPAHRLRAR